jgi:hypothetical protein
MGECQVDAPQKPEIAGLLVEIDRRRTPHKFVFSLEGRIDVPPCRVSVAKFSNAREIRDFAKAWVSLHRSGADESKVMLTNGGSKGGSTLCR